MTAQPASHPLHLPGAVTLQREPDGLVLHLTGEVDAAVVGRFTADPDHQPTPVAAIDAGAVTFISSAGLALMLRWAQAAGGGRPVLLRRSARCVDRVLQQTGLDAQFSR
ncbi:STAS domain-containing protein [Geodermatophilus sp. SYSU D01062]